MTKNWWKLLAVVFIIYTIIAGLLFKVPHLAILHESIRNLYFHVPMWFTMIMLFLSSVIYSVKYLKSGNEQDDLRAVEGVNVGVIFGILGLLTGSLWAKFTWGTWWTTDPKLNSALIAILIYLAYLVLRGSLDEEQKRARIGAVYNIFAFPVMIVLVFVLPRMTDSLHPGNGGNPGFGSYDLDRNMRMVFYPACIGWILIGFWIKQLRFRIRKMENYFLSK
ncbi:ABC transporter permease [Solitalea longa]|uniref:Heme exporter protein C n=1 Tax=Solitalea longa TaxID=2079460 RepID=A0A2S5A5E8_9SPHI|nr:cytochrome c biogenesis protein CcsA [Solitalea longa]POY37821.1 ABC transporter permease [Solitalea longa]